MDLRFYNLKPKLELINNDDIYIKNLKEIEFDFVKYDGYGQNLYAVGNILLQISWLYSEQMDKMYELRHLIDVIHKKHKSSLLWYFFIFLFGFLVPFVI